MDTKKSERNLTKEFKAEDEVKHQDSETPTKEIETLEYATINFAFPMSRYEATEILTHPKGKVMKSFTAYMNKVVVAAAKKYADIPVGEIVTDCKVPIE